MSDQDISNAREIVIETTCYFCGHKLVGGGYINGNHWTGERYLRVDVYDTCYSTKRLTRKPRQKRQPRTTPIYVATDYNMLVSFTRRGRH